MGYFPKSIFNRSFVKGAKEKGTIRELQSMNVKVYMLTGDNKFTAKAVADELKLDGFEADCLPDDKYKKVKELQEQGHIVAMAGDV